MDVMTLTKAVIELADRPLPDLPFCLWDGGGMRSVALSLVSGRYLSFAEREEIAILHARDCGVREIARRLGRSASTISRKLRRNAATRGGSLNYRATTPQ
jgi:DNA-binding CsgD family transcriptional regulator